MEGSLRTGTSDYTTGPPQCPVIINTYTTTHPPPNIPTSTLLCISHHYRSNYRSTNISDRKQMTSNHVSWKWMSDYKQGPALKIFHNRIRIWSLDPSPIYSSVLTDKSSHGNTWYPTEERRTELFLIHFSFLNTRSKLMIGMAPVFKVSIVTNEIYYIIKYSS